MAREFFRRGRKKYQTRRYHAGFCYTAADTELDGPSQFSSASINDQEIQALSEISDTSVKGAVTRLKPQSRLMMILLSDGQFSYRDIAYITGLRVDSVKTILTRLRRLVPRNLVKGETYRLLPLDSSVTALDASGDNWDNEGGAANGKCIEPPR